VDVTRVTGEICLNRFAPLSCSTDILRACIRRTNSQVVVSTGLQFVAWTLRRTPEAHFNRGTTMLPEATAKTIRDPACSDTEFRVRVGRCSPEELAQCVRLLGMYLAMYKRQYGELEVSAYAPLANHGASELALAELMAEGMDEASAMLTLIQTEAPESDASLHGAPLN
jgi:hypothetical protein